MKLKDMENGSYTATILAKLLKGETLTSSDINFSNTNQYFVNLKKQGIELIEVWKPNKERGKHKERRLNQTIENISRAKRLLSKLVGKA